VVVRELIELLSKQPPDAVVMTWELWGRVTFVTALQAENVKPVELCKIDNDGLWTTDVYKGQYCDSHAFPGVVIGVEP